MNVRTTTFADGYRAHSIRLIIFVPRAEWRARQ
jgi:hypothetical protein